MESDQATRCEKQERSGVGEGEKQSMRLSVSYQCGDDRPITDAQYTLGLSPELCFCACRSNHIARPALEMLQSNQKS